MTLLYLALPRAVERVKGRLGERAATVVIALPLLFMPRGDWCHRLGDRYAAAQEILAALPDNPSIEAQANLVPHLSPSPGISLYPSAVGKEWIVLDVEGFYWPLDKGEYERRLAALLEGDEYGVVQYRAGVLLLQRGAPADRNRAVLTGITSP